MPTAALTDLMDELAATLESALGTDVAQVVPLRVFSPTPPCIDIYDADPARSDEGQGFGELTGAYLFIVRARVNATDNDAGQTLLYQLKDEEHNLSIATALEDDQTLNGLASSVDVGPPSGNRLYNDGGRDFLGCEWPVKVLRVRS